MLNDKAKQWVAALRSGAYKQGFAYLHRHDEYCCLGVACDLAIKAGLSVKGGVSVSEELYSEYDMSGVYAYEGKFALLPLAVQRWLSLTTPHGMKYDGDSLTSMNDRGMTFAEIADLIESEPEGLFREQAA